VKGRLVVAIVFELAQRDPAGSQQCPFEIGQPGGVVGPQKLTPAASRAQNLGS
jgi:hypothetical protein